MKILLIHNRYQIAGGEETVVHAEQALLSSRGHEVRLWEADNRLITGTVGPALHAVYSPAARRQTAQLLDEFKPDVVHVHNFFPLLSPAIYYACGAAHVPVVQTLHNYRLICPNALLFRDGHVCEDCVGRALPWPGVWHACYRDSHAASLAVATMLTTHRLLRTWSKEVGRYIVLSEFAREKFVSRGGLPAAKIEVKPNFVHPAPSAGDGSGGFALYVGRLSEEKGLKVLVPTWQQLGASLPLKIVGDGPLRPWLKNWADEQPGVEYVGLLKRDSVIQLMRQARLLVFPSLWYEGFPMTIIEAFATALPVIASDLGSAATLIEHRRTGLHFRPGDSHHLAEQIHWALAHPAEWERMRQEARKEFETHYTADRNYELLSAIYSHVCQ